MKMNKQKIVIAITGASGSIYAKVLLDNQVQFDQLFGPAYKGLPLATTTAVALAELGKETTVTFNRKETKDHGEGGQLIGSPLWGKTVIIDDVITAGTAFRESQQLIKDNGGELTAVIIVLDRCERGVTEKSAISEIRDQNIKVYSIINCFDLLDYLKHTHQENHIKKLESYLALYGC